MTDKEKQLQAIFGTAPSEFEQNDTVILPTWFKTTKRQGRVNIIALLCPERGRGYAVLVKKLRNGKMSKDRLATIYYPLGHLSSLRKFDK